MITLAIEVVYYRRREAREAAVIRIKPLQGNVGESTPPPSYDHNDSMKAKTFVERARFAPGEAQSADGHVSFVSVYPRRSIHGVRDNAMEWCGIEIEYLFF